MKQDNLIPRIEFNGQKLTRRQIDILELIAEGYSNQEICDTLFLAAKTIESHMANIRTILSGESDRLNDRRIVLLAKEMVDGAKRFAAKAESNEFELAEELVEYKRAA